MHFPTLTTISTLILALPAIILAADTAAWKSRSIYFALTDRVARSETDTGGETCSDLGSYCGGTFKGLESKLDYIQGAGFDALWITPVVANKAGGYHGYWAEDLYSVNTNYGTADDLKALVSAAHAKGMYVMVDVVANHMGKGDISVNKPAPLNDQSAYHAPCATEIDYSNQTSVEMCEIAGLPDINSQSPEVQTMFQTWIKWLVTEYSFDGVRIDTVKHVDKDFWKSFSEAAGVYCIGEVWNGATDYLAGYADTMPGLLDYAMFYPMNKFYQQAGGSAQDIVDMHANITAQFPDPSALGTFLDNHDNPRWLSEQGDVSLFKNALAYVMLARGIPIVYYGSEQGYNGGADPANRESLWNSNFNTSSDLYVALSKMGAAKKSAGGLAADDHVHLYVADNAYAWSRAGGNLIVLTTNTGNSTTGNYCFNAQKNNGAWTNVLGSGNVTSDGSGNICLDVSNGEPVVLVAGDSSDTPAPVSTVLVSASPSASASPAVSEAPAATETTVPEVITSGASDATATVVAPALQTTLATVVATPTSPSACPSTVAVTFTGTVKTEMGETIKLIGNVAELGSWDLNKALVMSANGYTALKPVWSITVQVPAGSKIKYKFVKVGTTGRVTWEGRTNRAYTVPCKASATVGCTWGA